MQLQSTNVNETPGNLSIKVLKDKGSLSSGEYRNSKDRFNQEYFNYIDMCEFCYGEMMTGQPHICFSPISKHSKSIQPVKSSKDKEDMWSLDSEEEVYQGSEKDEQSKPDKPELNKIKIKTDMQGVYLKQNEQNAHTEGKKTSTGRVIPNYKKLDQECKASPTEYFKFICQEEHSTFHQNGNIATFSKIQKVEERAGGKRTRSKAVQEGLAPSMDAFKKTLE